MWILANKLPLTKKNCFTHFYLSKLHLPKIDPAGKRDTTQKPTIKTFLLSYHSYWFFKNIPYSRFGLSSKKIPSRWGVWLPVTESLHTVYLVFFKIDNSPFQIIPTNPDFYRDVYNTILNPILLIMEFFLGEGQICLLTTMQGKERRMVLEEGIPWTETVFICWLSLPVWKERGLKFFKKILIFEIIPAFAGSVFICVQVRLCTIRRQSI